MKNKLTLPEKQKAVATFKKVSAKIKKFDVDGSETFLGFTPEEIEAVQIVEKMVSKIAAGWGTAGRPREAATGLKGLYFRAHRAEKKYEDAKERGVRGVRLEQLREDAEFTLREYEVAKSKE